MNFERALTLLKGEEPLQIIQQPPPNITINEGSTLQITCEASSYPPPEYQWFKDDEELLLQQESMLSISCVNSEDSGVYVCQVSKKKIGSNENFWLSSDPVKVCVLSKEPLKFIRQNSEQKHTLSVSSNLQHTKPLQTEDLQNNIIESLPKLSDKIVIKKQPRSPGKIAQGSSLSLRCVATASYPVKYQWYQNGQELDGETSQKLSIIELYPDSDTGERKFQYFCEVFNDYYKTFSKTVTVELAETDDETIYVAEDKIAFLIANDVYEAYDPDLVTPAIDVVDLSKLLKSMDFKVIAFRNLSLSEMKRAFAAFCGLIKVNSYVVFFFAGHGFECFRQTYLQPIDCTENFVLEESMCCEYILQQIQEAKPALILLLIDACRKPPPEPWDEPVEIFKAPMKNNTVYGYATTFLNGAYETDEQNSYFVKYLKKYINHDKSIQDIILRVQRDFEEERSTRNIQHPVIQSSLSVPRKLRDELRNPEDILPHWAYHERNSTNNVLLNSEQLKCSFIIEIADHMDVYLNGVDITLSIHLNEDANLGIFYRSEINLVLNTPELEILSTEGVHLKNVQLNLGKRNLILKKKFLECKKYKVLN
ncbi:mucosa-associated lymphoid tissue lymphoma translocation protein 1 [Caerostris extrusa]|uniref:Mucosa-associated lymphoid tissue lymphoma translocation protein 1 n=1 Tax=Caerostris extrusa TaxID=172846 RepID=A0AAV4WNV3_CAEEX|nr:mucosa-associated lymphoid tissue lymphoma translocation protein 1 [Caerostris extrusa]